MSADQYQDRTLPQVVAEAALTYGECPAITDGEVQLTYAALDAARIRAARAFIAAGLEPGERIAIWAPNIYQWIIAAVGAQSIGAVLVPLNTRLKGAEAAYILNTSGARLLFTVGDFLGVCYPEQLRDQQLPGLERIVMLSGEAGGTLSWEAFLAAGDTVAEEEVQRRAIAISPDDTLDILFTSGTTGRPKGVVTSHGQNIRTFATWSATVGLRSDDNYLIINPFFHSFGYKAGWLAAIIRGAHMLPVKSFDLDQVLARIARDRISMIPGPPTIYQSLLAHPRRGEYDLSSLRLAVTGAAPVPVELVRQMREELGFELVVTAYGLTESCGVVSICRADDSPERISHSSGRAMDGIEMKCVDEQGRTVPAGTAGEIWCRGFNVMRGYLDDPQETARAITADGWLKTGDVGVMDEDGYVRITDRIKDMFITGGFNCYPAEIENTLCSMPGVARAAVIGVPDERLGEVAMAYIVPAADAALGEAAVIAWCRDNMANYKVPRAVCFAAELPMNASGKVLKTELRQRAAGESPVNDLALPQLIDLDETDHAIIALLRSDGRLPYRAIAREVGLTEATVRARVRRLEESNTMRVVAVTDIEAAGFSMLLAVGVQVENRSPEAVARELAGLAEVFSVNVVVGAQDVEILVVARDQADLNDLMTRRLAGIPGVRRLTPALALDVLKNQPDWVPFHD